MCFCRSYLKVATLSTTQMYTSYFKSASVQKLELPKTKSTFGKKGQGF